MGKDTTIKERPKQVWFMPWADLKTEIKLGQCTIWPFIDKQIEQKIQDEHIKNHLRSYFASYVNLDGTPVNTIAICSYNRRNMTRMRDDEHAEIKLACDVVAFSVISRGIRNFLRNKNATAPAASDRFKLLAQNFIPGNNGLAVRSGRCLSGGWLIGQITFPRPWCLGGPFQRPDDRLLTALAHIFDHGFDEQLQSRIARSLEWFRLAHTESDDVSDESKVVMMATALETLLAVPKEVSDKQVWIADWLDKTCTYSASIQNEWKGQPAKTHSAIGYWSRSFYDLRNSIVHGGASQTHTYPLEDGTRQPHISIAAVVFWECLCRILFRAGCFPEEKELIDKTLEGCTDNYDDQYKHLMMTLLDFGDMHRVFGWLPPLEMLIQRQAGGRGQPSNL